jgi:hypothetical protein
MELYPIQPIQLTTMLTGLTRSGTFDDLVDLGRIRVSGGGEGRIKNNNGTEPLLLPKETEDDAPDMSASSKKRGGKRSTKQKEPKSTKQSEKEILKEYHQEQVSQPGGFLQQRNTYEHWKYLSINVAFERPQEENRHCYRPCGYWQNASGHPDGDPVLFNGCM